MKNIKYIIRSVLLSAVICVMFRVIFGLYSVLSAPAVILTAAAGLIFAAVASPPGGFFTADAFHIILTAILTALTDISGVLNAVPTDSAKFFASITGSDYVSVNILRCIVYILPLYFITFIFSSAAASRIKRRKILGR